MQKQTSWMGGIAVAVAVIAATLALSGSPAGTPHAQALSPAPAATAHADPSLAGLAVAADADPGGDVEMLQ